MNSPLMKTLIAAAAAAILPAQAARAHYIWVTVEPAGQKAGSGSTLRAFFNEPPFPDADFTRYVRDVTLEADGQPVPSTLGDESRDASWVGRPPATVDARRDLGVMTRGGATFRLLYTARAQTGPLAADAPEPAAGLRVRLIGAAGQEQVEVLFDGKPVPKARIRVYPDEGEPSETAADEKGRATVPGLVEGKTALWANWVEPKGGEADGKSFKETRHYATFTYRPQDGGSNPGAVPTAMATMPGPAVNSFGGAVLGEWLYVYSGHVGRTHRYSVDTTSKHFRRLSLKDRTTWEDLPLPKDVQGAALVSDGAALYRIGGMAARNRPGEEHDLHSVDDFARFDPGSKTWTELPPMPEPRSTHDAVVIGRTVYVAGGWTMRGATEGSTYPETLLALELDRPETGWKAIPAPFRRRALSAAEHGGKLYVIGGLVGGGMKVERRVDVYDPATGTWTTGPDLPGSGRNDGFGTSAFGVEGRLYASGASGRINRLNEAGDAWEAVGAWWLPRITHRLLPGPGRTLLAVSGNAKGRQTPVIEAVPLPGVPPAPAPAGAKARVISADGSRRTGSTGPSR